MPVRFLLFAATLVIGSGLPAQSALHTRTLPKVATGTFAGSASSFPFGRTGGRVQYWFRQDQIHAPSITTAIGSRPSRNYSGAARTQSVAITAANTTLGHQQFTKVFAQNLGAQPTVVHARKNVSIPALSSHQNPDQPGLWVFFDAPFPLIGPNLVLEFDLGPAASATSAPYNTDLITLSGAGKHMTSDPSCGGTLVASATSSSFSLKASSVQPSQPVFILLSLEATMWAGQPLPIKLDVLGMPGCLLGVEPKFVLPVMADPSGNATLSASFPTPSVAQVLYAQAVHPTTTTPSGVATTNVTRSITGASGFCSYIYNFTVDGPTAQNGPYNWQGCLLIRP